MSIEASPPNRKRRKLFPAALRRLSRMFDAPCLYIPATVVGNRDLKQHRVQPPVLGLTAPASSRAMTDPGDVPANSPRAHAEIEHGHKTRAEDAIKECAPCSALPGTVREASRLVLVSEPEGSQGGFN